MFKKVLALALAPVLVLVIVPSLFLNDFDCF